MNYSVTPEPFHNSEILAGTCPQNEDQFVLFIVKRRNMNVCDALKMQCGVAPSGNVLVFPCCRQQCRVTITESEQGFVVTYFSDRGENQKVETFQHLEAGHPIFQNSEEDDMKSALRNLASDVEMFLEDEILARMELLDHLKEGVKYSGAITSMGGERISKEYERCIPQVTRDVDSVQGHLRFLRRAIGERPRDPSWPS